MAKIKVDFTGVETSLKCEEGRHIIKAVSFERKESQAGNDMLVGKFEVVTGDSKGANLYENFLLSQNGLWKLKSYLTALGVPCEGKITLDPDKLIGKKCIAEVVHETYNDKVKAKIDEFKPYKDVSKDDDDEDEEDDIDEEDEDTEEDDEEEDTPELDLSDLTVDQLRKLAKSLKIKKAGDMNKAKLKKSLEDMMEDAYDEVAEAYEELFGDSDDEDDEEEEEAPKSKSKGKDKGGKGKDKGKKKPEPEEDEDDDDDWEDEEDD